MQVGPAVDPDAPDGDAAGLGLLRKVKDAVNIPVIAAATNTYTNRMGIETRSTMPSSPRVT